MLRAWRNRGSKHVTRNITSTKGVGICRNGKKTHSCRRNIPSLCRLLNALLHFGFLSLNFWNKLKRKVSAVPILAWLDNVWIISQSWAKNNTHDAESLTSNLSFQLSLLLSQLPLPLAQLFLRRLLGSENATKHLVHLVELKDIRLVTYKQPIVGTSHCGQMLYHLKTRDLFRESSLVRVKTRPIQYFFISAHHY